MSLKFSLGQVHITTTLKNHIQDMYRQGFNFDIMNYIKRHAELLDFGELTNHDIERNLEMINNNTKYGMVLSSYRLPDRKEIWLITYIDDYSIFLFPEEY